MLNLNINSSRALAVLLVFLFHLNLDLFSGGFIGVDIFFVISGYVISLSLFKLANDNNGNNFLIKFYSKRLLRILPALIFLSIILVVLCDNILIDSHYYEFFKSIFYSNLFVSNFYFWDQFGYFGLENSFKPMLHTWSLSIEAQIYIFIPFLIYLIYKKYIKSVLILIGIFSFFSIFLANIYIDRPFVYFFPIFRIHEFFIGIIVFVYLDYWGKNKLNSKFVYLGLLLIILSSLFLNKSTNFPGFNSIFPVMGIALIILSEKNLFFTKYKIINFYGDISYSFYLYHWPIIVLYKYIFFKINLNLLDIIFIFFLTTLISFISYKFIELNFKKLNKKNIFKLVISIIILILISKIFEPNEIKLTQSNSKILKERELLKNNLNQQITKNHNNIIIIGDSHAVDFAISLNQTNSDLINRLNITYVNLNDDCLVNFNNKSIFDFITYKIKKHLPFTINKCEEQISNFRKLKLESQSIIISNRWSLSSLKYLEKLIIELKKNNNNLIIVNRRPSFFDAPSVREIKKNDLNNLNYYFFDLNDSSVIKINKKLKTISSRNNIHYVDLYNQICFENKKICNVIDKNGNILFIDNDHFSIIGLKYFGPKIEKLIQKYFD